MKSLVRIALFALLACLVAPQTAEAKLIQAAWFFDGNDNADVSSLSQTVTAVNGNITFDFNVSITSSTGRTVIDTSVGDGISSLAGGVLDVGEVITFTTSITNIVQNGPFRVSLTDLSFRFLGTEGGNGTGGGLDTGTVITPTFTPGSSSWATANTGPDFNGHLPGFTVYGGPNADGFFIERGTLGGAQQVGTFSGSNGFDIPRTNITNGGAFGTPVLTFSHRTDMGTYRLNDIIVQVSGTPEPSSMLLGLIAALIGMFKIGWRRTLQLVGFRKASELVTS